MNMLNSEKHASGHAESVLAGVKNAVVTISGQRILQDISLEIEAGEIVTIVGLNGSGRDNASSPFDRCRCASTRAIL